jgi:hypothetical protein
VNAGLVLSADNLSSVSEVERVFACFPRHGASAGNFFNKRFRAVERCPGRQPNQLRLPRPVRR